MQLKSKGGSYVACQAHRGDVEVRLTSYLHGRIARLRFEPETALALAHAIIQAADAAAEQPLD